MAYTIYTRYALATESPWKILDTAESDEAAMECMKHPPVDLLDDTLIKVNDSFGLLAAFGLVQENEGKMVDLVGKYVALDADRYQKVYFAGMGFNWSIAWENVPRFEWGVGLCGKAKVDHRLLVSTVYEIMVPYIDRQYYATQLAMDAVKSWIQGRVGPEEVYAKGELAGGSADFAGGVGREDRSLLAAANLAYAVTNRSGRIEFYLLNAIDNLPVGLGQKSLLEALRARINCADLIRNIAQPIRL